MVILSGSLLSTFVLPFGVQYILGGIKLSISSWMKTIMGWKTLCFALSSIFIAYYIYLPIPGDVDERWKIGLMDAAFKMVSLLGELFENIGLMKFEDIISIVTTMYITKAISDENVTVLDADFGDIPVRLYLPKRKSERQRPAVIFLHGGGFVLGSCKMSSYDFVNRCIANKVNAVVLGIDYRLAPQYRHPVPFEDSVFAVKFFLRDKILAKYGVDPTRICIYGDSSGSMLAAKVTQMLQNDPEFKYKLKAQVLIYPGLQMLDTLMPSYQEYGNGPILTKDLAVKLISLYVTEDKTLLQAMRKSQHMPQESRHLFKFVNWSVFLPEKYKKNHVYTEPILGKLNASYPTLMDSSVSPLLVNDSQLQNLPLTYILTCEYDPIRDDGLIYVTRLRNAGVQVTHEHIENGVHGVLSFTAPPFNVHLGYKIRDKYIRWLEENL